VQQPQNWKAVCLLASGKTDALHFLGHDHADLSVHIQDL